MRPPNNMRELVALHLRSYSHRQLQELAGAVEEACPQRTTERDIMGMIILWEMHTEERYQTAIQGSWDANGAPV